MKKTIQILRFSTVVLLLATTQFVLQAEPPGTGIQGRAALYISYGTPMEIEPGVWVSPGDVMTPVATSFSVLSAHSGREVGRFSTDTDGAFTISLPPGKYVLVPDDLTVAAFPFSQSLSTSSFELTVNAKKFSYALILYYHEGPFTLVPGTND